MFDIKMKNKHLRQLEEYRRSLMKKPDLRNLFLELTLRCNEHCLHCGSWCGDVKSEELSVEQYRKFLEEVKEDMTVNGKMLCITGGEPLLRKEFFEIMEVANNLDFKWGMTSNATLINDEVARDLKRVGMGTISVSIDGLEETHDAFRQTPGGYKKAMNGLESLIRVGGFQAIQATTVVTHQNIGQLDELFKIFNEMDPSRILHDAADAYLTLGMSANQYLSAINDVGAAFSSTMGDAKGYDTAKTGLRAIADFASGTGKPVELLTEKFMAITRSASSYQSIADQFSGVLPATSAAFLEQAQAAGFLEGSYKSLTKVPIDEYQAAVASMLAQGTEALGLTGNTAAEAVGTVSGSLGAMRAAWAPSVSTWRAYSDLPPPKSLSIACATLVAAGHFPSPTRPSKSNAQNSTKPVPRTSFKSAE